MASPNEANSVATSAADKKNWRESFAIYWHPRIFFMGLLGFSAGLPFLLVFSTLTAWLTEVGVSRASIGFFTWIGITYSIKVFWAPVVDRIPLPFFSRVLGQRRSWILLAQLMIAGGLIGIALTNPATHLMQVALFALLVAFGSATQDISIDAWRIEAVEVERQAAMSAVYVFAYRMALIVAGAGALNLATFLSWSMAYWIMAALVGVGMFAVFASSEPIRHRDADNYLLEDRVQDFLLRNEGLSPFTRRLSIWFIGAVICPFMDFFSRYRKHAFIFLLVIGGYRICDICMASMAIPFYLDLGFTKQQIGMVSGIWGVASLITGVFIGGLFVPHFGLMRLLLVGAGITPLANLLFSWLATMHQPAIWMLALPIIVENFCSGFAIAIFIAWMSSLTNSAYTATQYAVFSSLMTLPAKFIGGFSGLIVEEYGYVIFFAYASCLGIPAVMAVLYLLKHQALPVSSEMKAAQ